MIAAHRIESQGEPSGQADESSTRQRAEKSGRRLSDDFAPVVMTAGGAQMMRPLQLAAIGAFGIGSTRQRMMGPAHITPRFRCLFLGDGHLGTCNPIGRQKESPLI
jgi:hypothetical protein